jgi:hypothetical protein
MFQTTFGRWLTLFWVDYIVNIAWHRRLHEFLRSQAADTFKTFKVIALVGRNPNL